MHPVTRTCPCCGSAFTTDNLKRKYCSDTCRNTHQMRKKRARTKARKARIETSAAREALEGKTHLSISEAAKFLGVSRPTLYARIEQGELTPLRVSTRTVRIPIEQLETSTQMQPKPTKGDFSSLKLGRNDIDGDNVFVNCVDAQYVAQADRPNELHRKYFDIHIPLEFDERIGMAALDPSAKFDFDEASDCGLPKQSVDWFTVKKGEFAICWPVTCPHAPAVTTDVPKKARKLIVKVLA